MKNRISYLKRFIIILVISMAAVSCEKEETKMPEILSFELGYENSKTVNAGSDLHIDAEILAENGIDLIIVEIHFKGDHKKSISVADEDHHGWEVNISWDKFMGLKNTSFHEHIEVPDDAEPGEYHFHFRVVDMEGYTAEFEDDIEVL
jgi:hypothetical protein